ncbi:CP27B protein, partial [Amia calva]|nr:CP27B protein [Amia calva]
RLCGVQAEGLSRYGPVWKASFGPILTVHVAEPALIEEVLRQEGQHPIRSDLSSWKDYRQQRGHSYGLLTSEGEEWQRVRSLLGKQMLCPRAVGALGEGLNAVVTDLLTRLQLRRRRHPAGLVTDVTQEFYRYGLEGVSSVLFETRLGCLAEQLPPETERFVASLGSMFSLTLLTMAMPHWLHRLLPQPWQRFCASWDYMFQFAQGHIDKRLSEEAERVARGEGRGGQYLASFLSQQGLSMKDVYGNVTELLLAGVDTISSSLSWSLYELSRAPELQSLVREEVEAVMGGRAVPESTDIAQMPLLKAVVKEVLRLYPVIPANARVIADRDITVGGYLIPKKTLITLCHYATSRDPRFFPEPDQFCPQRWLDRTHSPNPFATLPFGVGKRSCIGRRIALLELHLALARILTHFEVRPDPAGGEVRPMTRTLLVPASPINLQLNER